MEKFVHAFEEKEKEAAVKKASQEPTTSSSSKKSPLKEESSPPPMIRTEALPTKSGKAYMGINMPHPRAKQTVRLLREEVYSGPSSLVPYCHLSEVLISNLLKVMQYYEDKVCSRPLYFSRLYIPSLPITLFLLPNDTSYERLHCSDNRAGSLIIHNL